MKDGTWWLEVQDMVCHHEGPMRIPEHTPSDNLPGTDGRGTILRNDAPGLYVGSDEGEKEEWDS